MNLSQEYAAAMSYNTYVKQLKDYQSLHQLHYNKFEIPEKYISRIGQLSEINILVITEPWCSDSLALLPIIRKLAEIHGQWEIKILLRDKNPVLMQKFLTNGVRGIPVFLFLNKDGEYLFSWGPRPIAATKIYEAHLDSIKTGLVEKQRVIKKIRAYYAKDRGQTTLRELFDVFSQKKL